MSVALAANSAINCARFLSYRLWPCNNYCQAARKHVNELRFQPPHKLILDQKTISKTNPKASFHYNALKAKFYIGSRILQLGFRLNVLQEPAPREVFATRL